MACNFILLLTRPHADFQNYIKISAHTDGDPRYSQYLGGKNFKKRCLGLESYYFCELGAHAKFRNSRKTPSGRIDLKEKFQYLPTFCVY